MKAYKVFNENWTCRAYNFTGPGTEHKQDGKLELCGRGFHFCVRLAKCFDYYSFDQKNKVAEIEVIGDTVGNEADKMATNHFKIVREIGWDEVLKMVNTGHSNTGHSNTGDRNTGHSNTGNWNTGNWNTGALNTTNTDQYRVFNKWVESEDFKKIKFPSFFYFDLTTWVSFDTTTEQERVTYKKEIETCGGFLKVLGYKEAWKASWDKADKSDRDLVFKIPGFDADLFFEISGIDLRETKE